MCSYLIHILSLFFLYHPYISYFLIQNLLSIISYSSFQCIIIIVTIFHSSDLNVQVGSSSPTGPVENCAVSNGGCDQLCIPTDTGRECSCLPGYTLNADGTSCTSVFCVCVCVWAVF